MRLADHGGFARPPGRERLSGPPAGLNRALGRDGPGRPLSMGREPAFPCGRGARPHTPPARGASGAHSGYGRWRKRPGEIIDQGRLLDERPSQPVRALQPETKRQPAGIGMEQLDHAAISGCRDLRPPRRARDGDDVASALYREHFRLASQPSLVNWLATRQSRTNQSLDSPRPFSFLRPAMHAVTGANRRSVPPLLPFWPRTAGDAGRRSVTISSAIVGFL